MDKKKTNKKKTVLVILLIAVVFILAIVLLYALWLKPLLRSPISEALDLSAEQESRFPEMDYQSGSGGESDNQIPVCGDQNELLILVVGIDYRGEDYLYGLADVVRLVRIDFTIPRVNVVAIPRAMLVEVPESLKNVEGPILINQAYLFGTPGMGKYEGGGYGAGGLAATIYYNFNLKPDHYLVIDFEGFQNLIDTLGGIEVDLPMAIDAEPAGYFPAGKQTLDGESALRLARTRKNYGDNVRISNQTIILQGIFEKLKSPENLLKLPELVSEVNETVLTDASMSQIQDALCLVEKLDSSDVHFFQPDDSMIYTGWEFIPSMDKEMNIYRWDHSFLSWLHGSLFGME
jgi:polyisoprenyl-teichoic acid--peptidoglycan teichoic acid transferase